MARALACLLALLGACQLLYGTDSSGEDAGPSGDGGGVGVDCKDNLLVNGGFGDGTVAWERKDSTILSPAMDSSEAVLQACAATESLNFEQRVDASEMFDIASGGRLGFGGRVRVTEGSIEGLSFALVLRLKDTTGTTKDNLEIPLSPGDRWHRFGDIVYVTDEAIATAGDFGFLLYNFRTEAEVTGMTCLQLDEACLRYVAPD